MPRPPASVVMIASISLMDPTMEGGSDVVIAVSLELPGSAHEFDLFFGGVDEKLAPLARKVEEDTRRTRTDIRVNENDDGIGMWERWGCS